MSSKLINYSRTVFISDIHAPFHDEIALLALKDFIKWFKPDDIIFLGDVVDFYAVSSFVKDPVRALKLQDEIDEAKYIISDICKVKAKKYFIKGNHECFHKDTELLCENGWKNIAEITTDDKVGQFGLNDNVVSFDHPEATTSHISDFVYEIENNAMKQVISPGHEVVYDGAKYRADSLPELISNKFPYKLTNIINPCQIDDDVIRLLTWVVMDGTIVDNAKYIPNSKKIRIQFHLSKTRKIDSLKSLLERLGINYTLREAKKSGCNKLTPYYIRIYGDDARKILNTLDYKKEFPDIFNKLDKDQISVLLDTIIETDGSSHYAGFSWPTTSKHNLDLVTSLMSKNGFIYTYRTIEHRGGFVNSKTQYLLRFWKDEPKLLLHTKVTKVSYNDIVYCVTMPKGTVISRIHGKVALTGNCRLQKYLWSEAKELASLRSLQFENLMDFKKQGINYIQDGKMNYKGIVVKHGSVVRKFSGYTAKAEFEKVGMSGVSGHTHRQSIYRHTNEGGAYIWVESGCLCRLDQEYMNGEVANWSQGVSIGYFKNNSKRFHLDVVPIINGKAQYAGMEFY